MNRKTQLILSIVTSSLLLSNIVQANENIISIKSPEINQTTQKFAQNEVILSLKDKQLNNPTFKNLIKKSLGENRYSSREYQSLNAIYIKSNDFNTSQLISIFKQPIFGNFVKSASPNNIMTLNSSNDTYYDKLWAIENVGQEINNKEGTYDADMDVDEAWEKTKGSRDVIVAVFDTGIDYQHSDLKDNMWQGNIYHGYDFAGDNDGNNDNNPMPDEPYDDNGHYHGTHVAGIIGATGDNNNGISGVAQKVSLMAIKVFRPNGYAYDSDIMEGLDYVSQKIDEGENIVAINASYGGSGGSQDDAVNDAIKKLGEKGVIFCAAAGNNGEDIDKNPIYPASYNASNIIAVGASDQDDKLASFSNYGKESVDIVASGTNILSTYPDNQYAYMDGTSMATPNITGSIALIASLYPNSTVDERKNMLLDSVDKKDELEDKILTGGRANINQALEQNTNTTPNNAPVANDDNASTQYETPVEIDVLANDTDEDGDSLYIKSITQPENGKVEGEDNGNLVYTPNSGFSGDDSFEYTITDNQDEASATVKVTVAPKTNHAPVAKDDEATTEYEKSVTIDVLANDSDEDGDTLTVISTTTPANGTTTIDNNKITYTPDNGFSGEDSFEYTISDGEQEATAKVTVTVKEEESNSGFFGGLFNGWSFW